MTERSTSHIVGATVVGGVLGAGLALLFAPRSGKETRGHIQQKARDAKQHATDKIGHVADRVRQTGRKAKSELKKGA